MSTETLAQQLGVSHETIRRDLVVLEQRRLLTRVHGGAAAITTVGTVGEAPFVDREHIHAAAKKRIGAAAVELLLPGQTVMIDVGTTALEVARAIPATWTGTVATCSLLVAVELGNRPGIEVLVCGGRVRAGDLTLSNHIARNFFADLHPDIAFVGSGGLSATAGLTDYHFDEVDVRRTVIKNARTSWVLADASKLNRVVQYFVSPLEALNGLITDGEPVSEIVEAFATNGGDILTA